MQAHATERIATPRGAHRAGWLAVALCGLFAGAASAEDYFYTVVGPGGEPVARHIIERTGAGCEKIRAYGVNPHGPISADMTVRFQGSDNFPITVCEHKLDKKATKAEIFHGTTTLAELPLPKAEPTSIVVLGDTGCRVKSAESPSGDDDDDAVAIQNCDNYGLRSPDTELDVWPLHKIAEAAAAKNPDLVVHVGDFIYRKAPCPPGNKKCETAASAYGTAWTTLKYEIFVPARPLMRKAAWVVPRGNHENCNVAKTLEAQGGIGFFLVFDPRPLSEVVDSDRLPAYFEFLKARKGKGDKEKPPKHTAACPETTPAYTVPVGSDLTLWVVDSNEPEDEHAKYDANLAAKFKGYFEHLQANTTTPHAWIVTHRPLYGIYPGSRKELPKQEGEVKKLQLKEMNVTLQQAFEDAGKPSKVDLVVSGHMHVFQALSFLDKSRPPDLTVGNSGTQLDEHFMKFPGLVTIGAQDYELGRARSKEKVKGFTVNDFGFLWLTRHHQRGWDNAALLDRTGARQLVTCALAHGEANCTKH
jgi:hypothetical protein